MIKRHQHAKAAANWRGTAPGISQPQLKKSKRQNGNAPGSPVAEGFRKFAHRTSELVGTPGTFLTALLIVAGWAISGPLFGYSNTWQLVINTATTIVTFLMVFLIQNTQNRDAKAIHLKLDELIHSVKGARDKLIDLENCSDEELASLQEQFKKIGQARQKNASRHEANHR